MAAESKKGDDPILFELINGYGDTGLLVGGAIARHGFMDEARERNRDDEQLVPVDAAAVRDPRSIRRVAAEAAIVDEASRQVHEAEPPTPQEIAENRNLGEAREVVAPRVGDTAARGFGATRF